MADDSSELEPLQHPQAVEIISANSRMTRIYYDAEDINNDNIETLRKKKLLDVAEEAPVTPCHPKTEKGRFYFRTIGSSRVRSFYVESNPVHDSRIDTWLSRLAKVESVTVATRSGTPLSRPLRSYAWESEVHRIVAADQNLRHDLFGAIHSLRMSINTPHVAIEVINTHYPEDVAMSAMLNLSSFLPLIVVFDIAHDAQANGAIVGRRFSRFTDFTNEQGEKFSGEKPIGGNAQIRTRFYIKEGYLWDNNTKTSVVTQRDFKSLVERK